MDPAHLVIAGQRSKYNGIDGRSLTGDGDGSSRAQTPPTAILFQCLKRRPRGRGLAGPPPPSGQTRAGPETRARRGPGKPRTPPAPRGGGACGPEPPPPPRPPTYLGAVGEGKCRSQSLGPFATRRSGSSARPPGNRHRRRHQLRHRAPLRGQRAEGRTASHAARRQRFAPGAPPSLPAHW